MPFRNKGRVKFRYDARSCIDIATSFYLFQEKVLVNLTEHHRITQLRHTPQCYTEIELVTDSVTEIFCVWTLAGENQEEASLPPKQTTALQMWYRQTK